MADLDRKTIVDKLKSLLTSEQVLTDEKTLQEHSHDRYRKLESIFGIYSNPLPAAVVRPKNTQEVSKVLAFLHEHHINCVPRTGASATEGGLETTVEDTVVVDGSGMDSIVKVDEVNMMATAQCGVNLQVLEDQLLAKGFTTGHSPQSRPLAQMGGLVATRSIGQLSTLYGAIEDMVIGLEAVWPDGTMTRIKNVPRRACGPDIRHLIIGNEGALCFITEVTVKIFKHFPSGDRYYGYAVDDMQSGIELLRQVMVEGLKPSVARLYDPADGKQHGFNQFAGERCVLIFKTEGHEGVSKATGDAIDHICSHHKASEKIDSKLIEQWFSHLNWGPEKIQAERDSIRKTMNMGFTTEVSGNWDQIHAIYTNTLSRIKSDFPHAEDLTLLGCHSSHSYQTGTNLYFVYDYNVVDCEPSEEIQKYHIPLNAMIVEETLKVGGSMVHHHGVGKYRTPWIKEEHGSAYALLEKLKNTFDPNGIMNHGTLFAE